MSTANNHPLLSHQRQVHLDFHTSPFIPDVGSEFDARRFAQRMRQAQVNSVTVFAKCHHGQCYYPTTTGVAHPALAGRDLLGEQIEALHREGIRCPIYTTVAWEEDVAQRFPQWRMMRQNGSFARCGNADMNADAQPAGWWFNNWLHPDYQDYIEAHLRELVSRYGKDVDGFFLDIVFFPGDACWSEASRRFRATHSLEATDRATQVRFDTLAQESFSRRFTALIKGLAPQASIFYNSPNPLFTDARLGVRSRHDLQSHWELESLPSGFWGYHHFPRLARAFGRWGKPWLGMTGRFQRMWGDFGGLKPQAALEYECFRSQALGGANSIGDQLPPRGTLDEGAYDLIGAVYAQVADAEAFYEGSTALPQVGIIAPGSPAANPGATDKSLEGAVQMCEEAHYDAVVLDDASTFDGLTAVILPDSVEPTPALLALLKNFAKAGGAILASDRSGFASDGQGLLPGLSLQRTGTTPITPTYWRSRPVLGTALSRSDRVLYQAGSVIAEGSELEVAADRVLPYFQRTDLTYCSHFQAPPRSKAETAPAVLLGERVAYFADPVFREYRQHGNTAARDGVVAALRRLAGPPLVGDGLPTTILCVPRRRGSDLLITLIHYIPTRKALDIDMIEERSSFAGEILRLDAATLRVADGSELPQVDDGFLLPQVKGRLLLEAPDYFSQ
ncbi:MAG: beta-galactosidase [Planctomycetota bacterium]|nr:MAG: beta-galactosidase [Planctomycetota bacterium]